MDTVIFMVDAECGQRILQIINSWSRERGLDSRIEFRDRLNDIYLAAMKIFKQESKSQP